MPTLVKLGNVLIRMYADDNIPPHFHVVTPDHEALVRIEDLEIHQGAIDRRSLERARAWAAENRSLLWNEWRRLNER